MGNNNKNNNKAEVKKSIINVCVNGLTARQALDGAINRIATVEKSIFNIAILAAYSIGVDIPAYTDNKGITHGHAICDKPYSRNDALDKVGRTKSTLSKWISAIEYIVEKGWFTLFATGELPFSYDKINIVRKNPKAFEGVSINDIMSMTVKSLMAECDTPKTDDKADDKKTDDKADSDSESSDNANEEGTTTEEDGEVIALTIDGIRYLVDKSALLDFLADNAEIEEEEEAEEEEEEE